jgi:hypothetical protein
MVVSQFFILLERIRDATMLPTYKTAQKKMYSLHQHVALSLTYDTTSRMFVASACEGQCDKPGFHYCACQNSIPKNKAEIYDKAFFPIVV